MQRGKKIFKTEIQIFLNDVLIHTVTNQIFCPCHPDVIYCFSQNVCFIKWYCMLCAATISDTSATNGATASLGAFITSWNNKKVKTRWKTQ